MINKLQEVLPPIGYTSKTDIRCHLNSAYTYYGMSKTSDDAKQIDHQTNNSLVVDEYRYINNAHKDITVGKRDGLFITIAATPTNVHKNTFIIRRTLTLKGTSFLSAVACVSSITNIQTEDMQKIKDALGNIDTKLSKSISIMLDYHIDLHSLDVNNNTIYHYQSDTVISLLPSTSVQPHPYSYDFLNIGAFGNTQDYTNQPEFNFKIKYFNHSPNTGPKYINILGKVFVLHPQRDSPTKDIVVYVGNKKTTVTHDDYIQLFYSNRNTFGPTGKEGIACEYYSLEDARDKLGVYDNYLEALTVGDIDSTRKKELNQIAHDIEEIKLENLKQKALADKTAEERRIILNGQSLKLEESKLELATRRASLDQEKTKQEEIQSVLDARLLQLENSKKLLDMERKEMDSALDRERAKQDAKIKQEQMFWQDYYEKKTYARKDTSDMIKFVPGLLIGLCGIAATWIKLTNKPA